MGEFENDVGMFGGGFAAPISSGRIVDERCFSCSDNLPRFLVWMIGFCIPLCSLFEGDCALRMGGAELNFFGCMRECFFSGGSEIPARSGGKEVVEWRVRFSGSS